MQEFTYLQNNSQRGFTLLETLMSMAVVSLVVTGVAFGTLQVMKYYIQDRDKLERENTTLLIKRMAVLANTQVNLRHFNVNRSYAKNNQKLSVSTETSDDIVWDVQSLLGQEGGGFLRARLGNVSSMSSLTVHNDSSTLRFFKLIKDGSSYRKALKNLVVSRCVLRDGGGVDPNGNTIDPNNPITSALYVVESLQMRPFIENVGGRIQIKCCPANQGPAVCTASPSRASRSSGAPLPRASTATARSTGSPANASR